MKIAIVYSSITGNTKLLADTIYKALKDKEIVYVGNVCNEIPEADFYFIGSWTNKGNASDDIINFIEKLENKKVAIFGTAGYALENSYYEILFNRIKNIFSNSNKIIGYFYCQGKMPMSVRDRYVKMITQNPEDSNLKVSIENFDEALKHPDEKDLTNAYEWATHIVDNEM